MEIVRNSNLDTNHDMTDHENGLCVLLEVLERLNELFGGKFANPLVVSLPFERRSRIPWISFIGSGNEIRLKCKTRKVNVLPVRNRVYKEELQLVSHSTVDIMNRASHSILSQVL